MYERRHHRLLSLQAFANRVLWHAVFAALVLGLSLAIGIVGYEHYEHLGWRDSFLNAAMLLGGMGPVNAPITDGGKIFAGLYALYAGLVFLIAIAIVLAPVMHRVLHAFHTDEQQ